MKAEKSDTPPRHTQQVRLASGVADIEAAQRLRYNVFYDEYGAQPSEEAARLKRDIDQYDSYTDHLIVTDRKEETGEEVIVGTYRLLKRSVAERHGGFYSAGEYDLSPLLKTDKSILELGRSCVLPEYRTRAVLQLLWEGIADYIADHNIDLLFGCASLPGTDIAPLKNSLAYLYHYHMADDSLRPRALESRYIDMNLLPKSEIDAKRVFAALPPLIKGYLRAGALIGDGAVIDTQFNTTDVFVMMPTEIIAQRYRNHYERKLQKPLPGVDTEEEARKIVSALAVRGSGQ